MTLVGELIRERFLSGFDGAGAEDHASSREGQRLAGFQSDATVATSHDGGFACEILALAEVLNDLIEEKIKNDK